MSNFISMLITVSSLMLSGCFSSPTNDEEKKTEEVHLLWEYAYDLDGGAPRVVPAIIEGQTIISSGDMNVTSLDIKNGSLVWKAPFDHHRQLMNRSFAIHEEIIVGTITRKILAWNKQTGEEFWSISFDDSLSWSLSRGITNIKDQFVIPGQEEELYFISSEGNLNVRELDVRSYETTVSDGILYAGQRKGYPGVGVFSAMDAETMELLWRFEPGEFGFPSRVSPIVENGIVYAGTVGGPSGSKNGFFALDAQTGEEIWRREGIFTYSAVLAGDRIFGVNGQRVWALNKETGELLWITRGEGGHSESNLDYLDGYVYWAHGSGLHVFDGENGELLHVMPSPNGSYFWLVTAGAGRIFAQSNRHLYAFAPWGYEEPLE